MIFIERQDASTHFLSYSQQYKCYSRRSNTSLAMSLTASTLLAALEKSHFIVWLVICEFIFNITLLLSKYIQKSDCDLPSALKHADSIISVLQI